MNFYTNISKSFISIRAKFDWILNAISSSNLQINTTRRDMRGNCGVMKNSRVHRNTQHMVSFWSSCRPHTNRFYLSGACALPAKRVVSPSFSIYSESTCIPSNARIIDLCSYMFPPICSKNSMRFFNCFAIGYANWPRSNKKLTVKKRLKTY